MSGRAFRFMPACCSAFALVLQAMPSSAYAEPPVQVTAGQPKDDAELAQRFDQAIGNWNVLDGIVVKLLNANRSAADINAFFTTLGGYEGPQTYHLVRA